MGSWLVKFSDKEFAVVSAASKQDAVMLVDEIAEIEEKDLIPLPIGHMDGNGFFVGFKLKKLGDDEDGGDWEMDEISESIQGVMMDQEEVIQKKKKLKSIPKTAEAAAP